jgi:hypothetical protein
LPFRRTLWKSDELRIRCRAANMNNLYLSALSIGANELSRKSGTALGSPGSQNTATRAGAHTGAKAVSLCPTAGIGLECALHGSP